MGARLVRLIRRERVDIVHTFFASADLWGGFLAKLSRRPVLVSSRRDMGFLRTAKHKIAYRLLGGMFDRVLTVSEQVRRFSLEQDGLNPSRVTTIYNAVEVPEPAAGERLEEIRRRFGVEDASHVIATVGNLRYVKGLDVLIRAAARVAKEFPRAKFVIAGGVAPGEPGYLEELQKLCCSLNVSGMVQFMGPVKDVIPLLRASDVFCLLSRSEGFSNALLEAMACGLPCVATRVGGNEEALEGGHAGYLVDSGDCEAAVECILRLLRDPVQARCMGDRARDVVARRFTPESVNSQLVRVYDELLSSRRSGVARQ
jgi:glycosyltransferase involved in cell wall biosynthesis